MISFIKGIVIEKDIQKDMQIVIINANCIGYEVHTPANSFYSFPSVGSEITLYTHLVTKEDGQFLYGFITKEQRFLFRELIKINSIGPKSALMILSEMEPSVFVHHVLNNNPSALERVPGIGAKTAKRLILDLRDKINKWKPLDNKEKAIINPNSSIISDAISALIALGYKPQQAQNAIMKFEDQALSIDELIRLALKQI